MKESVIHHYQNLMVVLSRLPDDFWVYTRSLGATPGNAGDADPPCLGHGALATPGEDGPAAP